MYRITTSIVVTVWSIDPGLNPSSEKNSGINSQMYWVLDEKIEVRPFQVLASLGSLTLFFLALTEIRV